MLCEIYLVLLETCRRRGCWQQRLFHQSQWTRSVHIYDGPIIVTRRMMYCTCVSSAKAICSRVFDNELSLRLVDERSASRRMDGWYTWSHTCMYTILCCISGRRAAASDLHARGRSTASGKHLTWSRPRARRHRNGRFFRGDRTNATDWMRSIGVYTHICGTFRK